MAESLRKTKIADSEKINDYRRKFILNLSIGKYR